MGDDSEIVSHPDGGITFAGPDAVALYAATTLWAALGLYIKSGIKVNRAYTPTKMLAAAGQITGKTYKRGQHQLARDDLKIWMDTMSAALPKR
ncbi:hypothetical protein I6F35_06430 [Bradyrhizobium sp. BRP22]|uniref:hypothetical protein n=1 Tax=Bradyrhizobium sp. BRP22 TaxID=2793821 RepID=UPI001CD3D315|nr:hypothetical protein [Bradyrhizobium sp. BRP22]MCA1452857.1 hypothetical protein [Bradyrhizobium sp. BRP22]